MKIETFNKENLRALRIAIDKALQTVNEEFGVKLNAANISFSQSSAKITLEAKSQNYKPTDWSELYGYAPIGTKFSNKGVMFTVIEHQPNRPKYPIIATDPSGKKFKFPADAGKRLLS